MTGSDWTRDLRQGLRALGRTPGFAAVAVLTLGLAIGVNAGIFSVVETVLLDPLPFDEPDRLVYVGSTAPGSDLPEEFPSAIEFYVQYGQRSELIEGLSTYNSFTSTLRTAERTERIRMSAPTPTLFATLGVDPLFGRLPTPEDESRVVVLSHALWTTWFGADEEILGRSLSVSGEDREVIAVMPETFWFPSDDTLLWFPRVVPDEITPGRFGQPMVARLKPGADADDLSRELTGLAQQLPERFGGSTRYEELLGQHRAVLRSMEDELLGDVAGPLWILLASMAIVLLIASANVGNLFMVRAERRQPDLAVRRALGAGRGRLVVSQLAESVVVAGFAGLVAVLLARLGVPLLVRAAPEGVPRLADVSIGPETLLFTFVLAALSALLCGLVPAVRFSAPSLSRLREGGRGGARRRPWGRDLLVVAQTALALVLLVGSALLLRSFDELRRVDPGYETSDLFTFQIAPEEPHLVDAQTFADFHLRFMDRLAALPGVESVGLVENVPLDEGLAGTRFRTEDMAGLEDEEGALLSYTYTAGDYFAGMGIELVRGRTFEQADHTTQRGNILISRMAAEQLWPGQEAVGQRLQIDGRETWETVVGVVDDVRQFGFRRAPDPMVYLPLVGPDPENSRVVSSPGYVLKTTRADVIAPEVRALVREVAPTAPMYRVYTMEFLAERSMVQLTFTMLTLGLAALLALILGVVGLYGVLSYTVAQRTREIGVRMALGAEASRVRRMIVGQGARVLAVGIAVGLGAAWAASRSLDSLLYEIASFDLPTYLAVAALMTLVGLVAAYVPAWRASCVDPMESLRVE